MDNSIVSSSSMQDDTARFNSQQSSSHDFMGLLREFTKQIYLKHKAATEGVEQEVKDLKRRCSKLERQRQEAQSRSVGLEEKLGELKGEHFQLRKDYTELSARASQPCENCKVLRQQMQDVDRIKDRFIKQLVNTSGRRSSSNTIGVAPDIVTKDTLSMDTQFQPIMASTERSTPIKTKTVLFNEPIKTRVVNSNEPTREELDLNEPMADDSVDSDEDVSPRRKRSLKLQKSKKRARYIEEPVQENKRQRVSPDTQFTRSTRVQESIRNTRAENTSLDSPPNVEVVLDSPDEIRNEMDLPRHKDTGGKSNNKLVFAKDTQNVSVSDKLSASSSHQVGKTGKRIRKPPIVIPETVPYALTDDEYSDEESYQDTNVSKSKILNSDEESGVQDAVKRKSPTDNLDTMDGFVNREAETEKVSNGSCEDDFDSLKHYGDTHNNTDGVSIVDTGLDKSESQGGTIVHVVMSPPHLSSTPIVVNSQNSRKNIDTLSKHADILDSEFTWVPEKQKSDEQIDTVEESEESDDEGDRDISLLKRKQIEKVQDNDKQNKSSRSPSLFDESGNESLSKSRSFKTVAAQNVNNDTDIRTPSPSLLDRKPAIVKPINNANENTINTRQETQSPSLVSRKSKISQSSGSKNLKNKNEIDPVLDFDTDSESDSEEHFKKPLPVAKSKHTEKASKKSTKSPSKTSKKSESPEKAVYLSRRQLGGGKVSVVVRVKSPRKSRLSRQLAPLVMETVSPGNRSRLKQTTLSQVMSKTPPKKSSKICKYNGDNVGAGENPQDAEEKLIQQAKEQSLREIEQQFDSVKQKSQEESSMRLKKSPIKWSSQDENSPDEDDDEIIARIEIRTSPKKKSPTKSRSPDSQTMRRSPRFKSQNKSKTRENKSKARKVLVPEKSLTCEVSSSHGDLNGSIDPNIRLSMYDNTKYPDSGHSLNNSDKNANIGPIPSQAYVEPISAYEAELMQEVPTQRSLRSSQRLKGRPEASQSSKGQPEESQTLVSASGRRTGSGSQSLKVGESLDDSLVSAVFGPQPSRNQGNPDKHDDSFDKLPEKQPQGPGYKYVDVVRKKDERKKLETFVCQECEQWYKNLDLTEEEKAERMKACRHKARFIAPDTPEHYWSIGFPDTEECHERGYLNTTQAKPSRHKRRRPLKQLFTTEKEDDEASQQK